MNQVHGLY
jgi:intraflagellar transport protein 122